MIGILIGLVIGIFIGCIAARSWRTSFGRTRVEEQLEAMRLFRQRTNEPARAAETRWLDAGGDGALDESSNDSSDTEHVVP
eukprot:7506892-Heterocapsa_arctica.AAC.1